MSAPFPHCNSETIHGPGDCYYCDKYPKLQEARKVSGLPFSPLQANGWSGNVAVKAGERHSHMGMQYIVGDKYEQCDLPDPGWYCLGDKGHDGPCAAWTKPWKKLQIFLRTGVWWP